MYTEGFESLEEAEDQGPRRTYVSAVSQQDLDRLNRENEKLKKTLEKEKFFNKLLDQELKDVKAENAARNPANYYPQTEGVSKGSFYTLLVLTLAMAAFILYTLYNNKQYNLFGNGPATTASSLAVPTDGNAAPPAGEIQPSDNGDAARQNTKLSTGAAVKDSVPNIIGSRPPAAAAKKKEEPRRKQAAAAPAASDGGYNEAEVEAALAEDDAPAAKPVARDTQPVQQPTATTPTPPSTESRAVVGKYKVTSKANFYNDADENTLRSSFISAGDKVVEALEDKNGFIFVVYTNDLGYTSKGWLSKKDLTKVE